MAAVMIGVDPHKGSHTAVVIDAGRGWRWARCGCAPARTQAEQLLAWAAAWPERTWAVEGAGGLGHLLAQQLVAAGERVLDVQPKLAARVRLLAAGDVNKNDPNDARSVAIAALRSAACPPVRADDHAAVLKVWAKRHRDLSRARNQVVCRMHAVLCELVPGGVSKQIPRQPPPASWRRTEPAGAVRDGPLRARRAVPGRPAPHRRPAPRHQEEAGRGGPGLGHHRDRGLRGRPGGGRRGDRRCPATSPGSPARTASPPTTAPRRSRCPPAAGSSTGCRCAGTGG